jgi:hypothetical protein
MWTPIRAQILLECVKEANFEEKFYCSPEKLENSVSRLQQLFIDVRFLFVSNELFNNVSSEGDCTIYDEQFYNAARHYLKTPNIPLNYVIKPQLTDFQLNTIKCVIETSTRFMHFYLICEHDEYKIIFPESMKKDIILKLSNTFDTANDRFISFFENIFAELNDNLNDECEVSKPKKAERIRNQIIALNRELDANLFIDLTMFIRSKMVTDLTF